MGRVWLQASGCQLIVWVLAGRLWGGDWSTTRPSRSTRVHIVSGREGSDTEKCWVRAPWPVQGSGDTAPCRRAGARVSTTTVRLAVAVLVARSTASTSITMRPFPAVAQVASPRRRRPSHTRDSVPGPVGWSAARAARPPPMGLCTVADRATASSTVTWTVRRSRRPSPFGLITGELRATPRTGGVVSTDAASVVGDGVVGDGVVGDGVVAGATTVVSTAGVGSVASAPGVTTSTARPVTAARAAPQIRCCIPVLPPYRALSVTGFPTLCPIAPRLFRRTTSVL